MPYFFENLMGIIKAMIWYALYENKQQLNFLVNVKKQTITLFKSFEYLLHSQMSALAWSFTCNYFVWLFYINNKKKKTPLKYPFKNTLAISVLLYIEYIIHLVMDFVISTHTPTLANTLFVVVLLPPFFHSDLTQMR